MQQFKKMLMICQHILVPPIEILLLVIMWLIILVFDMMPSRKWKDIVIWLFIVPFEGLYGFFLGKASEIIMIWNGKY
jgi:hypothetical protein